MLLAQSMSAQGAANFPPRLKYSLAEPHDHQLQHRAIPQLLAGQNDTKMAELIRNEVGERVAK